MRTPPPELQPTFTTAVERIRQLLEDTPLGGAPLGGAGAMVPVAALLDVLEQCAAQLRVSGRRHQADQLDALRRGFIARADRQAAAGRGEERPAPPAPSPKRRPVPGRRT